MTQVQMQGQKKFLMYSPDSVGLGHMRRNSAIASGIADILPDASTLLLVGSSAGSFFDLPKGADLIKLPSILKTGSNEWAPKALNVLPEVARNIRSHIISGAAKAFSPDVFLVDHVPAGIWDELAPALKAMRAKPGGPRLALGLRDILGAPEDIRARWSSDGTYDLIDALYDKILIYGSPDIFPACEAYGLRARFANRIEYCGFIHFGQTRLARDEARAETGAGKKPLVVMTAGGGHDAFPMMKFALEAMARRGFRKGAALTVVTGPLMPAAMRAEIRALAAAQGAEFLVSTNKLPAYLAAADAVLTMGGYNTVMEAVSAGVPTVVIPRTGPSQEQRCRAQLFARLGLVQCVDLELGTAEELTAALDKALSAPRRKHSGLAFDGIQNAAASLVRLAQSRRAAGPGLEAAAA